MEKPLVNKSYLLEKYPGKGGWTYASIPEVPHDKNTPFGWVKVKGSIDGYEFKNYNLQPMGNGKLFLPVKAEIRKKINKQVGDYVRIILYPDNDPIEIPEDLLICLNENPATLKTFINYTDGQKKGFINWILEAKTDKTKVQRITKTIEMVEKGEKFYNMTKK